MNKPNLSGEEDKYIEQTGGFFYQSNAFKDLKASTTTKVNKDKLVYEFQVFLQLYKEKLVIKFDDKHINGENIKGREMHKEYNLRDILSCRAICGEELDERGLNVPKVIQIFIFK